MKNQVIKVLFVVGALLFSQCESGLPSTQPIDELQLSGAGAGNSSIEALCNCLQDNYPIETLTATESAALLFMREEEKLARDVYLKLKEKWGLQVFANIAKAEQRHMDATLCLINKYNLTDPVGNNGAGVFQHVTLQSLYTSLVNQGEQSKIAALKVGGKIEDLDIYDLLQNGSNVDNTDILAVFEELKKGSRNHLRAFTSNLASLNETYQPEFIDQALFDEIINSAHERGAGLCATNCTAQGNGPNRKKPCNANQQGSCANGNNTPNCNNNAGQNQGNGNGRGRRNGG